MSDIFYFKPFLGYLNSADSLSPRHCEWRSYQREECLGLKRCLGPWWLSAADRWLLYTDLFSAREFMEISECVGWAIRILELETRGQMSSFCRRQAPGHMCCVSRSAVVNSWGKGGSGSDLHHFQTTRTKHTAAVVRGFHAKTLSRNVAAVWLKTGGVKNQDINSEFGANKEIRRTHDTAVGAQFSSDDCLRLWHGDTLDLCWLVTEANCHQGPELRDNPSNSIPGSRRETLRELPSLSWRWVNLSVNLRALTQNCTAVIR